MTAKHIRLPGGGLLGYDPGPLPLGVIQVSTQAPDGKPFACAFAVAECIVEMEPIEAPDDGPYVTWQPGPKWLRLYSPGREDGLVLYRGRSGGEVCWLAVQAGRPRGRTVRLGMALKEAVRIWNWLIETVGEAIKERRNGKTKAKRKND